MSSKSIIKANTYNFIIKTHLVTRVSIAKIIKLQNIAFIFIYIYDISVFLIF